RVGNLSVKEDDPDYFALALVGDILGGNSFTSRLFQDVRSRQGLAYSVGSRLVPGNRGPGAFILYALTKGSSTHQALASMLDHMERLRQEPVSDDELKFAKDAFLNSFVFSFADAGLIVGRLMSLEYYGLPKDFLQRFRDSVVKLTKEDLLRVARKHLHPDRVIILAVGKDDDFEKPRPASESVPCWCSTWSRADPAPPTCSASASGMRPSSRARPEPSTCGTTPRATSCSWRRARGSLLFARCSTP